MIEQDALTTAIQQRTDDDYIRLRHELAAQIIAANSSMFFAGSDQGAPNQHMQVRKFTNLAFSIAEEALISEKLLQHK